MKIQTKYSLVTGGMALVIILVLVAFSANLFFSKSKEDAIEEMQTSADALAYHLVAEIEVAFDAARTLAQSLRTVKQGQDLQLTRTQVDGMLKSVLESNPDFLGVYTLWEPQAFDGRDADFANTPGHDETGRYIPYWVRDEQGGIIVEPLMSYEAEGDGDYYQIPKKTKQEAVLEPYVYPIQGKDTLLTSLVAPVVVDGIFYGIAGVDLGLEFFQEMADGFDLFHGEATIAFMSNTGVLAGVTGKPELVGKDMVDFYPALENFREAIAKGDDALVLLDGVEVAMVPIQTGEFAAPWSVAVMVPERTILAKAYQALYWQIGIGVILLLVLLVLIWFIIGSIARPIRFLSKGSGKLARGDLAIDAKTEKTLDTLAARQDELGEIGSAFQKLFNYLKVQADVAAKIANGNLALEVSRASEADRFGNAFLDMTQKLNSFIAQVKATSQQVDGGSDQIASSSQALSQGATEQAASLEEITSSVSEVGSQTKANAENAEQASAIAIQAKRAGDDGITAMSNMTKAMADINGSSQSIGKIIKTIDEIAFQTNLLALNAAVEAARAGRHGKGFAVVAEEVRNLAARSANAAKETAELIEDSISKAEAGSSITEETAQALNRILESVEKVAALSGEIASASNEQATGIGQIDEGLAQVDQVTQQNAANAEETASAAQELASQATALAGLLGTFTLNEGGVSRTVMAASPQALPAEESATGEWAAEVQAKPVQAAQPEEIISLEDGEFGKY